MPTTSLLHCPTHHRSWQGDGSDAVQSCPWCEITNIIRGIEWLLHEIGRLETVVHELEEQVTALESERNSLRRLCEPVAQTDEEAAFYRKHDTGK